MEEIFKTPYLECFYDKENNIFFHTWLTRPPRGEFKTGLEKVYLEYRKKKKLLQKNIHWLADTRHLGVVTGDDERWLEQNWDQMLFEDAEVKSHAVITGNDAFAKISMEKFKESMIKKYQDKDLHLATFKNKDEAYEWFKVLDI